MLLPDERNPLARKSIYELLGIRPYADTQEVNARLEELIQELQALPEAQRAARMSVFQEAQKMLKNARLRVLVNALVSNHIDDKRVLELLAQIAEIEPEQRQLPPLSLDQVLIEGEDMELSQQDFKEVAADPTLAIDFSEISQLLLGRPCELHFFWDI